VTFNQSSEWGVCSTAFDAVDGYEDQEILSFDRSLRVRIYPICFSQNDSKMLLCSWDQVIAEQAGKQVLADGTFDRKLFSNLLEKIPVKLGGGKTTLSLQDIIPQAGIRNLEDILERYSRDSEFNY
jgi:hypothetical protein